MIHGICKYLMISGLVLAGIACSTGRGDVLLMEDGFADLPRGPLGSELGAETEYHYLPQAGPKGNWAISTFRYNLPPSWYIRNSGSGNYLFQDKVNPDSHWHPVIIAGSSLWEDYTLRASMAIDTIPGRAGIVFRYRHDRACYFFGFGKDSAKLIRVNEGLAFRQPAEKLLGAVPYIPEPGEIINIEIVLDGPEIRILIDGKERIGASDTLFRRGKAGFLADVPASFYSLQASTSKQDFKKFTALETERERVCDSLPASNPRPVVFRKIPTEGFGTGRNLRFGDLDGDGEIDILIGQVLHHGPKDRNSELSCLTAISLDGRILWQKGSPDPWKTRLTNDVAFQIHDIDNDGKNEVVYCMDRQLVIAEGSSGKILRKIPTPPTPGGVPYKDHNIFDRILGDCICFADLGGKGYMGDLVLKDRYRYLWAYNADLDLLWHGECNTGHYPYAYDTDGDGRDELAMGYTLFDDDGSILWSLDDVLDDHADGVAIVKYRDGQPPVFMCAASDEGMFFAGLDGQIIRHHYIGHVQNPAVANFRDDLVGLETVSVNFWGNQGIIHLFDSEGEIYNSLEPNQYGSMCLPLNWNGGTEELFVLNANVDEGGAWDGYGRRALKFPDDGHPDMCYAVLDITGDCRDEIVVWDPRSIWVYTQDDNPRKGKLYKPARNPLCNYSNYQATVSVPGWNR